MATPVPPIDPQLPPFPGPNTPESAYDDMAFDWGSAMPGFGNRIAAIGQNVYNNAEEARLKALAAEGSAEAAAARLVDVQTAANGAFAAANYKGEWSTLSGALNVPATVTHQGRLWYLKLNLANVTTQAPALGSTYWGEVSRNDFTVLPCPAGTTNAADRGLYRMTSSTSVLLLPAAPWHGMVVAAANVSGTLTPVISRNGKTICGDAENFTMNVLGFQIVLQYDSISGDWMRVSGLTAFTAAQPAIGTSNIWTASQNFTGGLNMNGIPIVERGSNSDGEYVRYADGTQFCSKILTINTAISNSDGGGVLYSPAVNLGAFPKTFSPQAPSVNLTVSGGAGAFITSGSMPQTTTSWGNCFVSSGASRAATNYYISCLAKGNWF